MQTRVFIAPAVGLEAAIAAAAQLSHADHARARNMGSAKRYCEFVSGRLLLRQSLAAAYGERSSSWASEILPGGALRLTGGGGQLPTVSLSHSRGRIACALSDARFLGVDIELRQPRRHLEALAAEVLHPEEMAVFSRLDAAGKARFFYAKWVMKEALGKAVGCGIHYPMREVLVDEGRLCEVPQLSAADAGMWQFSHTLLDGDFSLGLAWQGGREHSVSITSVDISL